MTGEQRIAGGLIGLLIGDAVGVPYEFNGPEDLPHIDDIDIDPPHGFRRSHANAPQYAWSDDGAHALCLLASLLNRRKLDIQDLANRLVNWNDWGYMAVDGQVFDVGIQTSAAISNIRNGITPRLCGSAGEFDNGNGALMRVLPLALWHQGTDLELANDAAEQSVVTHGHVRSQVACALYCLWARYELQGDDSAWRRAVHTMKRLASEHEDWKTELTAHVAPVPMPRGAGGGYVVDCLHSAVTALQQPDFASVIRRAIAFGDDTDTTAAVAGGIAGIRFGIEGIPADWLNKLAAKELYQPLLEQLIERGSP